MFPLKIIRPGLLEIAGNTLGASTYYIPIRSIRSFAVHENPVCIELHLGTVPSSGSIHTKVLFCTKDDLLDIVEFLTMSISSVGVLATQASLENIKGRIANLERLYDEQNKEIDESIYSDSGIAEASDSGMSEGSDISEKPAYTDDYLSTFYCSLLVGIFTLAYFIAWFLWISGKIKLHAH
jgi:hypothetical protein